MTTVHEAPDRLSAAEGAPDRGARRGGPRWALLPVLAPVLVFLDALVGRRLLAPADGFTYYLPLHMVAARMWRQGAVPTWDPWSFGGAPLLAIQQAGVFYPPNLAHLVLSPVLAENLAVVVNFAAAGLGAWLLARRTTGDGLAAAAAGLAFGLSGFLFAHIGHAAIVGTIAWLPWVLWGADLARERLSAPRLLAGAGPLALGAFAGHGQMWLFTVVVLGVEAAWLALAGRRLRPLLVAAAVVAAGSALAAVQLLPVVANLSATDRTAVDYATATGFSFDLTHLALLVFPYLFGNNVGGFLGARAEGIPFTTPYQGQWGLTELSAYVGAAALVLAAAGVVAVRRDRRVAALVVVGVVSLVVALGDTTPVARLVHALPVIGQMRSWARYAVAVDLVVAVLAAHGVAELRARSAVAQGRSADVQGRSADVQGRSADVQGRSADVQGRSADVQGRSADVQGRSADAQGRRRAAAARAVGAALLVVAAGVAARWAPGVSAYRVLGDEARWAVGLPVGAAVLAAGAAVLATRRRAGAVLAVTVVGLDMALSFALWYEWRTLSPEPAAVEQVLSDDEAPSWGAVPDAPGGVDRFAYASVDPLPAFPWFPRATSAAGLASVNGYDPLAPDRYLDVVGDMDYRGVSARPQDVWSGPLLDLLRVTLVVAHPPSTPEYERLAAALGPGMPARGLDLVAFPHEPALPEAFLVGAAEVVSPAEAEEAVLEEGALDPAATALVDTPCAACDDLRQPGPAGDVAVVRRDPSSARYAVVAARPALLVVSEAWAPGWRAEVDGRPVDVVRADAVVQGVPLPAGHHDVVLRYTAPGLRAGAAVTAATVLALGLWALAERRRSRSRRSRPIGPG